MSKNIDDCINKFHDKVRNHFESVGIGFNGNYPRCVPQDNVYLFYMDNLIKILKMNKKIDLMDVDDYEKNPIKYYSFLFERFEPILYDVMRKHNVKEFTIEFKDYMSSDTNVYELVLTKGIMVGKLHTEYKKKVNI